MRTRMHDQLEPLLHRDQKVPAIVIALTREGYGVVFRFLESVIQNGPCS